MDRLVEKMSSFLLGGRAWAVEHVDHGERTVRVREAPRGQKPSRGGFIPQMLSFELCQRIRRILQEEGSYPYVEPGVMAAIQERREELGPLLGRKVAPVQLDDEEVARWWTFAGGRINSCKVALLRYDRRMYLSAIQEELHSLIREEPRIAELARRQPDDPQEPAIVFARPEGQEGLYPMVEMPIPGRSGRLWVGRMPGRFGRLEEEVAAMASFGLQRVVCLLPEEHMADPDFYNLPGYVPLARERLGPGFHLVPVVDYEVPHEDGAFEARVEEINAALLAGERVLVHCGAGCGRAGMFVCCLMVVAGLEPLEAVRTYRRHRGCGPETGEQVAYVVRYARRRAASSGSSTEVPGSQG